MRIEHALQITPQTTQENMLKDGTVTLKNELGSTIDLVITSGMLTGTYTSAVGPEGPVQGPITGWVSQNHLSAIGFSVIWPDGSLSTWTGHIIIGGTGLMSMELLWYLATVVQNPKGPSDLWKSINAGADTFSETSS